MNSTVDRQKELNEKIATLLGWTGPTHKRTLDHAKAVNLDTLGGKPISVYNNWWLSPNKDWFGAIEFEGRRCGLPDYCNDLNAMHEAEKVVLADADKGYAYDMALCRIVNAYEVEGLCNHMRLFHATALQRAEAFVKTMEATSVQKS